MPMTSDNANQDPNQNPIRHADTAAKVQPLLCEGCRQLGITLSATQIDQFELYYRELVAWNERFNLTSITNYEDVQVKHFLDCLAGWPVIVQQLGGAGGELNRNLHAIDVGTGAGFPGVPLKIIAPRLKLTLVDGTGKKILFLRQVVQILGLANVDVVQGRAEELGQQTAFRGQFDLVTARAVAPLNTLVEYLLPLTRRDGLSVIYKGANAAQEFVNARKGIELLGGETVRFAPLQVPFLDEKRFIVLIKKSRPTPLQYPRSQGLARKKPVG